MDNFVDPCILLIHPVTMRLKYFLFNFVMYNDIYNNVTKNIYIIVLLVSKTHNILINIPESLYIAGKV